MREVFSHERVLLQEFMSRWKKEQIPVCRQAGLASLGMTVLWPVVRWVDNLGISFLV